MLPFNFTKVKFCSAKNDKFTACSFNFFTFFAKIAPHVAYYAKKTSSDGKYGPMPHRVELAFIF